MRRTLTYLAATAVLALPLAACGGSSNSGAAPKGGCPTPNPIAVQGLDRLKFDATTYAAHPGCIEVTYSNGGTLAHTLLVKGHSGFKLAIGKSDSGTVTLDPGTYTLFCDISGHEAAGMKATLTVR